MSRRDLIRMTDDEVDAYLHGRNTMAIATHGPGGRIHLVAMWYGFFPDGALGFWTYAKSQKIVNLRRDPRMTGLVETGDTYDQLRGVELAGTGVLVEDRELVLAMGENVWERYTGPVDDAARGAVAYAGQKRIAVRFDVDHVASWDHRKLAGAY